MLKHLFDKALICHRVYVGICTYRLQLFWYIFCDICAKYYCSHISHSSIKTSVEKIHLLTLFYRRHAKSKAFVIFKRDKSNTLDIMTRYVGLMPNLHESIPCVCSGMIQNLDFLEKLITKRDNK